MLSIKLTATRSDLLRALETLATTRQQRFTSTLPVWISFAAGDQELRFVEERGKVTASLPAVGTWPQAGVTVDLFMLKRAMSAGDNEAVDLHATADSLIVFGDRWRVRLKLLRFGPESGRPSGRRDPLAHLPLFEWGEHNRQ
jgi:hypothetical protein